MAFNISGSATVTDLRAPNQAPRSTEIVIYLISPQATAPSIPNFTNWAFRFFSDTLTIPSPDNTIWQRESVDITQFGINDIYWTLRIRIIEDTFQDPTPSISAIGSPVAAIRLPVNLESDNFVSGQGGDGWQLNRQTGGLEINDGTFRGSVSTGTLANATSLPTGNQTGALLDSQGNMVVGSQAANMQFTPSAGLILTGAGVSNPSIGDRGIATSIVSDDFPSNPQHGLQWINTVDNSFNVFDGSRNGWIIFEGGNFIRAPSTIPRALLFTSDQNTVNLNPSDVDFDYIEMWFVGGGGSGGVASTDSGREKVSSGGGAGGAALFQANRGDFSSVSLAVGGGGASVSTSGSGGARTGFDGDSTGGVFNTNLFIGAFGGSRGFGSRQTTAVGENSATISTGAWGFCSGSTGGSAQGGIENYMGAGAPGFSIGSDGSASSGGGSIDLGTGGTLEGQSISGGGFRQGVSSGPASLPNSFAAAGITSVSSGFGVQDSNGGAAITGGSGTWGCGGGGASGEVQSSTSGAGGTGFVIVAFHRFL